MSLDRSQAEPQSPQRTEIQGRLRAIENEHEVRVLLACESGSRAWGFASRDSDFDVRFIYLRHPDWYLSIDLQERRDVIEYPIDRDLDISGWDLRKALRLFRKSNPPLLEWLGSPIVYSEYSSIPARLRALVPQFYSPKACRYHYLRMARNNFREYMHGEMVPTKKYFYVLRPVLAIRWIEAGRGVVPTEFGVLVSQLLPDGSALRTAIENLVRLKRAGAELDRAPRIAEIHTFIEEELARHSEGKAEYYGTDKGTEPLNHLFREALAEIWLSQPCGG
jgi:hypothetical protein